MANYIGKIAAVGTINMAQFSRGLDSSAKDVERFAKRISSTLSSANSAAARSFDQIFTPIQRLERAIQARSRDRLNIDTGGAEARIRALVGAAEDIARPLGSSAKAFSGLSATIQNEFVGSLVRAQNAATTAQNNITRGAIKNAQDYERYKRVVDETVISIRRLSEAGSAVSGLATGRELRFQQADLASELQRASASQSAASALPADARRSGAVAQLVELQRREAEEAARLLSVLENIRNTRRGDAAAAQAALDAQVQRLGQVNSQLERQAALSSQVAQRQREVAQAQEQAATRFSATELNRRSGELARRNASAFDAATAGVLSQPQDRGVVFGRRVNTIETELSRLDQLGQRFLALPENVRQSLEGQRAAVENLANAARQNPAGGLTLLAEAIDRLDDVVRTTERGIREFRPIPGNADGEFGPPNPSTLVSTRDPTGRTIQQRIRDITAEREQRAAAEEAIADRRRRVAAASTFLPPVITPPDPTAERTAQLQGISDRLGPDIASSAAEFARLEAATVQVKSQIDQLPAGVRTRFIPAIRDAENALLRLAATDASPEELERATQRVVQLRREVTRTAQAATQLRSIGDALEQIGTAEAVGQLSAAARVLAQIGARAGGPAAQAYERLRQAQQRFIEQGLTGTPAATREIERLQRAVARTAAETGRISFTRAFREIQRGGDIARGSFGNTGIAIQQAVFAFDDFISVTGGIDQRIRAAGNNISQLGFILGGTAGLITGVVLSAVSQLAAGFIRWYTEAEVAEAATKRLNTALDQQRSKTEQLADSYRRLADSIQEAGLSEQEREFRRQRQPIEEIRQEQADRRREIAIAGTPQTGPAQARIDAIDKQLEQEESLVRRRRLLGERREEQAKIDAEIARVEQQAADIADTAIRFQGTLPAAARSLQESSIATSRRLRGAERRGDAAEVERLTRELTAIDIAFQDIRDRQRVAGLERQQEIANTLARVQETLSTVPGFRQTDPIASRVQDTLRTQSERLIAGEIDVDQFTFLTRNARLVSEALDAASSQISAFSDALDRAVTDIAQSVESELSQRSDSLRREANAAEARFGAGDQRTAALRSQQESIESARRAATRNRQELNQELSRQRLAFQESSILNTGNAEASAIGTQIAELQRLVATPATDQAGVTAREEARLEIERLRARLGEIFDALPATQELRRRADEGDIAAQRRIQEIDSQARGRELTLTPAQRAAEELNQQIQDIRNFFSLAVENSTGVPEDVERIRQQLNESIGRATEERARQVAPLAFGFSDEVANALLQGPSRAALQASDASTIQGQQELNRLLRGEDPARDVNLVELQKQTQALNELVQIGRAGPQVAQ
jgi:hypothetical protein